MFRYLPVSPIVRVLLLSSSGQRVCNLLDTPTRDLLDCCVHHSVMLWESTKCPGPAYPWLRCLKQ